MEICDVKKKYNELLDKGILPRKIGESACHIKHSSYWNSKEYYDDVTEEKLVEYFNIIFLINYIYSFLNIPFSLSNVV